jgi:hypothetical protein
MKGGLIECSEVKGKQIETLRIYKDTGNCIEIQMEFLDGTSLYMLFRFMAAIPRGVSSPPI